ncbi:MAG: ADP-ribosylglycohydrolase family protein [Lentisphaeria bacterium]|nr:ADP-ribosylglycohydrolase family protein [Lentisphaeria bacterium]
MRRTLEYKVYLDRILGGWIGKSLGGIVGAPYECHKQFNRAERGRLWPDKLYPNDDLDIQVVWLEALQDIGLAPTSRELAEYWQKHCFYVCCEYGIFIDNLEHGIYPPLSGTWNNRAHQNSEGCPIRSEIWGFISPGNPRLAMEYASRDGILDHGRISVELEQFLSAAASLAFFENSAETLLDRCCEAVPKDNAGRRLYIEVKELCRALADEHDLWLEIVRRFGSADSTDAMINNAFAIMALLRGGEDFKEMMRLCVQCGWDVDCSCATAGALWGALRGSEALPPDWRDRMGKTLVCACDIRHKTAALTDFAAETAAVGLEVAQVLNRDITVTGAPAVAVRPQPAAGYAVEYAYGNGEPVLRADRPTEVTLRVSNPFPEAFAGTVAVALPDCAETAAAEKEIAVPAGGNGSVTFCIGLKKDLSMQPEKVLCRVLLKKAGSVVHEDLFGMHASVRYLVYGPYWDMWDKEAFEICPYQNEELTCNPGNLPEYACDAFNTHVRPNHAYLDEAALLKRDLPEERPFSVEKSTGGFARSDLYALNGATCCYVVREFQSDEVIEDVGLSFSADCPFKCWLDGKLIREMACHTNRNSTYGSSPRITLTGKKQRLVVKLASRLSDFHFGMGFSKGIPGFREAHSPYVSALSFKVFRPQAQGGK